MKRWIAFHESGVWGIREDPKGGWVSLIDAETEIEKARREGYDKAYKDAVDSKYSNPESIIRAAERERIVRGISELKAAFYDSKTEHGWSCALAAVRNVIDPSPLPPQEPKPLEKLFFTDSEWDGQLYRKFNVLVDAVNDILRRLNEISPGNRP